MTFPLSRHIIISVVLVGVSIDPKHAQIEYQLNKEKPPFNKGALLALNYSSVFSSADLVSIFILVGLSSVLVANIPIR